MGVFNWMIPSMYIKSGCFYQTSIQNWLLGFQVYNIFFFGCSSRSHPWNFINLIDHSEVKIRPQPGSKKQVLNIPGLVVGFPLASSNPGEKAPLDEGQGKGKHIETSNTSWWCW